MMVAIPYMHRVCDKITKKILENETSDKVVKITNVFRF